MLLTKGFLQDYRPHNTLHSNSFFPRKEKALTQDLEHLSTLLLPFSVINIELLTVVKVKQV